MRHSYPRIVVVVIGLAVAFGFPSSVAAVGFGLNLGLTTGSYRPDQEPPVRYQTNKGSIGLLFDTNIMKDSLFNYRISAVYEKVKIKSSPREDYEGVVVEHDFGFGYATDYLRLWAGPELRVNYNSHTLFGIGAGPALGLNVDIGNGVALCLKGAYIVSSYQSIFSSDREKSASFFLGIVKMLGDDHPALRPVSYPAPAK